MTKHWDRLGPNENPYLPPSGDLVIDQSDEQVQKRLSRPATALIIMASIDSVFKSLSLIGFAIAASKTFHPDLALFFVLQSILFVCSILIAIGAAQMGAMKSLTWSYIGAILACLPVISPFSILGIPFGLWSLALLRDPQIRARFEAARELRDQLTKIEGQDIKANSFPSLMGVVKVGDKAWKTHKKTATPAHAYDTLSA